MAQKRSQTYTFKGELQVFWFKTHVTFHLNKPKQVKLHVQEIYRGHTRFEDA